MSITAIVKPLHDCNFQCKYCYINKEAEKGRMTHHTLKNLIDQVIYVSRLDSSCPEFIWHGGEPLLIGIEFFRKVVEFQKKHCTSKSLIKTYVGTFKTHYRGKIEEFKISNGIQSNGSLLNDDYIKFFRENNFKIGFSLDGDKFLNDQTRIYANGSGTYDDIFQSIQKAKEANIGGGFITILTKKNIYSIPRLYSFFKSLDSNPKVNPLIKSGSAKDNYEDLGITAEEYGNALIELFVSGAINIPQVNR